MLLLRSTLEDEVIVDGDEVAVEVEFIGNGAAVASLRNMPSRSIFACLRRTDDIGR
jgi:hypothetical protein